MGQIVKVLTQKWLFDLEGKTKWLDAIIFEIWAELSKFWHKNCHLTLKVRSRSRAKVIWLLDASVREVSKKSIFFSLKKKSYKGKKNCLSPAHFMVPSEKKNWNFFIFNPPPIKLGWVFRRSKWWTPHRWFPIDAYYIIRPYSKPFSRYWAFSKYAYMYFECFLVLICIIYVQEKHPSDMLSVILFHNNILKIIDHDEWFGRNRQKYVIFGVCPDENWTTKISADRPFWICDDLGPSNFSFKYCRCYIFMQNIRP